MNGEPPAEPPQTQGYRTVWRAPDEGPEQPVMCPECRVEIGQIGERGEREIFCAHCQTLYSVMGREGAPPLVQRLRRRVVIEGEGTMGQVLRGEQPDVTPWWATASVQAALWLVLLLLLALFLWAL